MEEANSVELDKLDLLKSELSMVNRFVITIKKTSLTPTAFFAAHDFSVPPYLPLFYWWIISTVIQAVTLFTTPLLINNSSKLLETLWPHLGTNASYLQNVSKYGLVIPIAGMLISPLIQLTFAVLYHVALKALGAATKPLKTTLNVLCFAVIGNIWSRIPYIGQIVAFFHYYFLIIVGLSQVHKCSKLKVVLAILLSFTLLFLCLFAGYFLLFWPNYLERLLKLFSITL